MELFGAVFADELYVLVVAEELDVALADTIAIVCAGATVCAWSLASFFRDTSWDFILLLELAVTIFHLDVIRSLLLMDMWIGYMRSKIIELDLLGKTSSSTHNSCKEASVSHFP